MDIFQLKRTMLVIIALVSLGGCSGDGIDGSGGKPTQTTIEGTAATGAPIVNASLAVKSSGGKRVQGTTSSNGKFNVDVAGLNGAFLLRVDVGNGAGLFSIASSTGTTNIHPITDLIIRNWFKVQGLDIETEFNKAGAVALPRQGQARGLR